ncbi:hypothetical protein J3R82DRAFT_4169 [Butyriboletus roseoflavus]|nr:hypothetical protein J3R82DRAFT_4169 [Butyriboletus roseoflavus]
MDTWQDDQLKRMQVCFPFTLPHRHTSFSQLGGNAPFKDFVRSYSPPEQGGYSDGIDPHTLYHSWAATQYREKVGPFILHSPSVLSYHKLDHLLAGKPWTPSTPHPTPGSLPTRPSSAQGLRKSRASARSPPTNHAPTSNQKSANEAYFTSLGHANAARPTDLPPSQGGRYQGFGNTPSPPPPSQHPSLSLTSAAAPSLADLQDNPAAALSKGWSLFSAAVAGASRVVNDNVIQPGMERVMDPNLHASVRGYVSEAQRRAQVAGQSVNEWSKTQLGVDVADRVNDVVGTVKDRVGAGPAASGYGSLALQDEGETSASYDDTNELFHEYSDTSPTLNTNEPVSGSHMTQTPSGGKAKKVDDWDEWKDF